MNSDSKYPLINNIVVVLVVFAVIRPTTSFNKLLEMIHIYSDQVSPFDQLIIYPSFIHVSFGPRSRRQVIDKRL